jgi:hypothetical protein
MTTDQAILEALKHPDEPQVWADPRKRVGPSIRERLMSGVRYEGECWVVKTQPSQQYPNISILDRRFSRHRIMFYLTNGRWPEGGEVRHTCDTKMCINPKHLIEGTRQNNADDARERGLYRAGPRATHCLNGHERTPENLYSNRDCKPCAKARSKIRYQAKKGMT